MLDSDKQGTAYSYSLITLQDAHIILYDMNDNGCNNNALSNQEEMVHGVLLVRCWMRMLSSV